jgi:geranylgeranyl diphosphate synthase type I
VIDTFSFKVFFDEAFIPYVQEMLESHKLLIESSDSVQAVLSHIPRLLHAGKRIRPYIASVGYASGGGRITDELRPYLYAIELFHLFALIHDDIIDRAVSRHGVRTIHTDFSVDQAILAGDLCLAMAYQALDDAPPNMLIRNYFHMLAQETILGQMLDVSHREEHVSERTVDAVMDLKTARYTFVYPARIGLAAAGYADLLPEQDHMCLALGRAFQRLDDLADAASSTAQLGKPLGSDSMQGTPTHLHLFINKYGDREERELLQQHFGAEFDQETAQALKGVFYSSGAVDAQKRAILSELDTSTDMLARLPYDADSKTIWRNAIESLRERANSF